MKQKHGPWEEVEGLFERNEMRMIQWMLGITLKDRKGNDDIRHAVGVSCITDKTRESDWDGTDMSSDEKTTMHQAYLRSWSVWTSKLEKAEEDHLARSHQPEPTPVTSGRWGSRRLENKNPCGWPLTRGTHSLKERERHFSGHNFSTFGSRCSFATHNPSGLAVLRDIRPL